MHPACLELHAPYHSSRAGRREWDGAAIANEPCSEPAKYIQDPKELWVSSPSYAAVPGQRNAGSELLILVPFDLPDCSINSGSFLDSQAPQVATPRTSGPGILPVFLLPPFPQPPSPFNCFVPSIVPTHPRPPQSPISSCGRLPVASCQSSCFVQVQCSVRSSSGKGERQTLTVI